MALHTYALRYLDMALGRRAHAAAAPGTRARSWTDAA